MREIDGRAISASIAAEVTASVEQLKGTGVTPTLAVVVPTDDEGSAWYVRSIERTAKRLGIDCRVDNMPGTDAASLTKRLQELSADSSVHAVMCQTPLPAGTPPEDVGQHIAFEKDVDGANPESLGRLLAGMDCFAPATAMAVHEILKRENVPLLGKRVVMVGRSTIVGKPAALLLLAEHATVTICHSRTQDLGAVVREADVVVAAVGRAAMITGDMVREGATVVDVGINRVEGKVVGDVAEDVRGKAGLLTPVPGGVGPMTIASLLRNTVKAARYQAGQLAFPLD